MVDGTFLFVRIEWLYFWENLSLNVENDLQCAAAETGEDLTRLDEADC